jgi:hypothetical protein
MEMKFSGVSAFRSTFARQGLNVDDVRLSFEEGNSGKAWTDPETGRVWLPENFYEHNQAWRDYTLAHETAHVTQYTILGSAAMTTRGLAESHGLPECFDCYERPSSLVNTPLQNLNMVGTQPGWTLEGIAHHVGFGLSDWSPGLFSSIPGR